MRPSHAAATTVAALTAGLTAAVALRRRAGRRASASALATAAAPLPVVPIVAVVPVPCRDGVVLPFVRPVPAAPTPQLPARPARCGDSGGQTKAGAPCAARAATAGRCHHHHVAA
jgi:hypothetical protein